MIAALRRLVAWWLVRAAMRLHPGLGVEVVRMVCDALIALPIAGASGERGGGD